MSTVSLLSTLQQSPYFDDYDETKKFLRMLFQPGVSLQVRELTQLQTILQNQIARMGDAFYKDGSLVTGGQLGFDPNVHYIRLADNADVTDFVNRKVQLLGDVNTECDVITGIESTTTESPTLIVRYSGPTIISSNSSSIHVVGDTSVSADLALTGTVSGPSSIATITEGIYYINGFFVVVNEQSLVLEKYNNTPTYRVGITISENVISSSSDLTLLDNASGSFNVNAPGADRFTIGLILDKKAFNSISDDSFIELMKVDNGELIKIVNYPVYSELDNTLARRTFDESGDYTVRPFLINVNDHKGSTGTTSSSTTTNIIGDNTSFLTEFSVGESIYLTNGSVDSVSTTISSISNNTSMLVSDQVGTGEVQKIINNDKVSLGLEPGKAYVKGYEYESVGTQYVSMKKGRSTSSLEDVVVNPNFGNYFRIDSIKGLPDIDTHSLIDIHCAATPDYSTTDTYNTTKIGTVRSRQIDYFSGTPGTSSGTYDFYVYDINFSSINTSAASGLSSGSLTLSLDPSTSSSQTCYVGGKIKITSGNAIGQIRTISSQSGNDVTIDKAFTTAIGSSDTLSIDFSTKEIESFTQSDNSKHFKISQYGKVDRLDPESDTKIFETDENSLVFDLPANVVKTVKPNPDSKFSYVVKHEYKNVAFTAGEASRSLTFGSYMPALEGSLGTTGFLNNIIVCVTDSQNSGRSDGDVINIVPTGLSDGQPRAFLTGTNTLTLDTNGVGATGDLASNDTFIASVITTVSLEVSANSGFRVKNYVNGTNDSFVSSDDEATLRNSGQYAVTDPAEYSKTEISLRTSDVHSLVAVVEAPSSVISSLTNSILVSAITNNTSHNITDNFIFNDGQKDNYYDHGSIILKPGSSAPTNPILIIFNYFTHGDQDGPFTVDSYSINYSSIPDFTSPVTGKTTNLRNCLDFRPRRIDGDITSEFLLQSKTIEGSVNCVLPRLPDADVILTTDIEYYLARKDKVVLNKNREFSIIEGIPSTDPVVPLDNENAMTLYIADIPEYTFNLNDIDLQYIENKRFTMRDIGKLEKRIEQLEYYAALSFLEKDAKDEPIFTDDGAERFKNGILVDQFLGHAVGDVLDDDYACSIDYDKNTLRPPYSSDNFKFNFNIVQSNSNVKKTGDLISVNYTDQNFIQQPVTTRSEKVNPFGTTPYNGKLTLSPSSDTWFSQKKYSDVLMNLEGQNDNWISGKYNYGFGTQWDSWSKNWSGIEVNNDDISKKRKKKSTTTNVDRSAKTVEQNLSSDGIISQNQPESIKKTINNRIVNDTIVPYNRTHNLVFKAEGLKPRTRHYIYIDDVEVTSHSQAGLLLPVSSQHTFDAKEGEFVDISVSSDSSITGTLVNVDSSGNTSFLITNTTGAWTDTALVTTNTEVSSNYPLQTGNDLRTATLTGAVSNTSFFSDTSGTMVGTIILSDGQFRAGERLIRITDEPDNTLSSTNSVAEKTYHIKGVESTIDGSLISTRSHISRREDIRLNSITKDPVSRKTKSVNSTNPMAQTFYVSESLYPNGMFLRNVCLYFSKKDNGLPIVLHIRPIINGVPSLSSILPFSEIVLHPDNITVTTTPDVTSSLSETKFEFSSPVYLTPGEYAFTLTTNSMNYELYTSIEGDMVSNSDSTNTKAAKPSDVGNFFVTQSTSEWIPVKNRSLMFKLQRCSFQTSSHVANAFEIDCIPSALSSSTTNTSFDLIKVSTSDLEFSNSVLEYQFQSTKNNEINPSAEFRDTSYTQFSQNKNKKLNERKFIRNDHFDLNSKSDFNLQCSMSTSDTFVSPIVDISRMNLITVKNEISNGGIFDDNVSIISPGTGYNGGVAGDVTVDIVGTSGLGGQLTYTTDDTGSIVGTTVSTAGNGYFDDISVSLDGGSGGQIKISSETDQRGGNCKSRYITRRVSLADGFDAKDLMVYFRAYKPSTSNVLVYYKVLSGNDPSTFESKYWNRMEQVTDANIYSNNENDFQNYTYGTADSSAAYVSDGTTFNEFKTFAIKLVFVSSKNEDVPEVKDLRVIALDE